MNRNEALNKAKENMSAAGLLLPVSLMERLEAVQCIVSSECDKEEAYCAYMELDDIIEKLNEMLKARSDDEYFVLWWNTIGADVVAQVIATPEAMKVFHPTNPEEFAKLIEQVCRITWMAARLDDEGTGWETLSDGIKNSK